MRSSKKITLGLHAYKIRQMGGMDAFRAQALLLRAVGEPLALIIGAVKSPENLLDLDLGGGEILDLVSRALPVLADRLDGEDLVKLAKLLIVGNVSAFIEGQEIEIEDVETYEDIVGARGPWHGLQLLQACVSFNFLPRGAAGDTTPSSPEAPAA